LQDAKERVFYIARRAPRSTLLRRSTDDFRFINTIINLQCQYLYGYPP